VSEHNYSDSFRFGESHTRAEWGRIAEENIAPFMAGHPEITSADSLYAAMRESGFYIPRADVREMWHDVKVEQGFQPLFAQWNPEDPLPRQWFTESRFAWSTPFAYVVKIESQTVEGETRPERYITLLSDNPLSPEEVEVEGLSWAARYEFEVVTELPGISIQRAIHRRGAPWESEE